jgi:acetoin utilization protein AcuC
LAQARHHAKSPVDSEPFTIYKIRDLEAKFEKRRGETPEAEKPMGATGTAAVLIADERFRRHSYGKNHPLGIPRVSLLLDLIRSYGAIGHEEYLPAREATAPELEGFHAPDYIEAIRACQSAGNIAPETRKRYGIGTFENPWFPDFFTLPALAAGGSVQGAEEVLAGRTAFNPAGGMHHAMPDRARGFCFFNDAVLAILRFRREGFRIVYVDMDAHHCDGVEYAFRNDPEVLTVSIHMDTRYAYPFKGGGIRDIGGRGNAVNLPLPQRVNDTEYRFAASILPEAVTAFAPDAVVLQAGTDILSADPLGKFDVSNRCFLEIAEMVIRLSPASASGTPRLLAIGGGGYHPLALARCWTGVWGLLSGRSIPALLPAEGSGILRQVDWDDDREEGPCIDFFTSRIDPRREGPMRPEIELRIRELRETHPLFGRKRSKTADILSP